MERWEIVGITREDFSALDEAWFHWQTIPPVEHKSDKEIERLGKIVEVDIVTGKSPETVNAAKAWLKKQGIKYNSFVRTASVMDKLKLSYDIFIDDSPELMNVLAKAKDRDGILYGQPWNENIASGPQVSRANSWSEIPHLVTEVLKEDGFL